MQQNNHSIIVPTGLEERADTAETIQQLATCAPFAIEEKKVQEWFEEYMD
ncbi:hypothetical protein [Capnocytophaga ochracea]|nr:hypothetical protein [Capnocytophaga ochracea]UZD36751.1 hypothetical protein OLG90_02385 [Capnocytophaga ochracea]